MQETKNQRFVRVAERRTNAVLEKLRVLANCANRSMYDYSDAETAKIFGAIKKAVRETELLFKQKSARRFRMEG